MSPITRYVELAAASLFSPASVRSAAPAAPTPEQLVTMAAAAGQPVLGLADRNSVAGLVRAAQAARGSGLRLLPGVRLGFADHTPDLLAYPRDRGAWGRLCRLLTRGRQQAAGLSLADLAGRDVGSGAGDPERPQGWGDGLDLILIPPPVGAVEAIAPLLARLAGRFPGSVFLGLAGSVCAADPPRRAALERLAAASATPLIALEPAGWPADLWPAAALAETLSLAERCRFDLDQLRPAAPVMLRPADLVLRATRLGAYAWAAEPVGTGPIPVEIEAGAATALLADLQQRYAPHQIALAAGDPGAGHPDTGHPDSLAPWHAGRGRLVLSAQRLDELVPLAPASAGAALPVADWDGRDLAALGLLTIDLRPSPWLALLRRVGDLGMGDLAISNLGTGDDPAVYRRLAAGETLGLAGLDTPAARRRLCRQQPASLAELAMVLAALADRDPHPDPLVLDDSWWQRQAALVYRLAALRHDQPALVTAALLNGPPLCRHSPARLLAAAVAAGVVVEPVDLNRSDGLSRPAGPMVLRLGLNRITGLTEESAQIILAARGPGFDSIRDLYQRTGLAPATLAALAEGGAFAGLGFDRPEALAAIRLLAGGDLPLFAPLTDHRPESTLVPLVAGLPSPAGETPAGRADQLLAPIRGALARRGLVTAGRLPLITSRRPLTLAGLVRLRQRPASGGGLIFLTLEDETGMVNVVIRPLIFEQFRAAVLGARLLAVTGRLQAEDGASHLVADQLEDLSGHLALTAPEVLAVAPRPLSSC